MKPFSYSKRILIYVFVACLLFFIDGYSKYWVQKNIPLLDASFPSYPYGGIGVFENFLGIQFSLVHAINKGAAWSVFSEYQSLLMIFRILLVALLIFYTFFKNHHEKQNIPLFLIICGALGNIVDYFFYGHVIDMFHFVFFGYHYPVFNIADSLIFIGICSLFLLSFCEHRKHIVSS